MTRHPEPKQANTAPPANLAALALAPEDLESLRKQGSVCREYRRGRSIYKLRFRRGGRQVARYLGTDPFTAAAIAGELHAWQSERRQFLELRRLDAQARRLLRETKHRLEQDLLSLGYHFHGLEIRAIKPDRTTLKERTVADHSIPHRIPGEE
jgi:hypothetical protein